MKFVSHEESRSWCEENGVHYRSLRMAVNINRQLEEVLEKSLKSSVKLCENSSSSAQRSLSQHPADTLTSLQYALCEGCVLSLARRCSNNYYRTLIDLHDSGGTRIGELHPSCSLVTSNNYPRYVVYQEVGNSERE